MKKIFCPLAMVLAIVSLSGCGLKGPLYFPPADKQSAPAARQAQQQPATQNTAPARNERADSDAPTQTGY